MSRVRGIAGSTLPTGTRILRSKSDFQRFCAALRTSTASLDSLVEGLRDLAASTLRPTERGRFAHIIARHLGESFPTADVRVVVSDAWPPEIAMALRSQAPIQGEPSASTVAGLALECGDERAEGAELLELCRERNSPLTVVFLGDEDEHRTSIDRLQALGIHCTREVSLRALRDAFARETVVGVVVGASWWAMTDTPPHSAKQRLRAIVQLSNLCWLKLVRTASWSSLQTEAYDICMSLYFSHPSASRFTVEDNATVTEAELRCLTWAAEDLFYAERSFTYDFHPSVAQDRILRAASSRYLRMKYPAVHGHEPGFHVRSLALREAGGLVSLVSVDDTDVAFVVKVSPHADALEEARRFRSFAHGASFEMEFFIHGAQGVLVFAPMDTRLGRARSLEDVLADRGIVGRSPHHAESIAAIDSAIVALRRFTQQVRPDGITTFCNVEVAGMKSLLASCGPIVVSDEAIDLRRIYERGLRTLDQCSRHAVVHGDAHPGNIVFSATNMAILIDYECAGLGPACYDLCALWVYVFASRFIALGDERSTATLLHDLLEGAPFAALESAWADDLRLAVNLEVVYLVHEAMEASVAVMAERDHGREDVYAIIALILCRELFNPRLQQFAVRCGLAAISSLLTVAPP